MNPIISLLIALVFISAVSVVLALYQVLTEERRVLLSRLQTYRVGAEGAPEPPPAPESVLRRRRFSSIAGLDRALAQRDFAERIALDLARANVPMRVGEYLFLRWALALAAFLTVHFAAGLPVVAAVAAVAAFFVPALWVKRRERQRVSRFNEQLVDVIDMISNSLKSGYSFLQGISAVARELPEPAAGEFSVLLQELTMGTPAEEALTNLTERIRSEDLDMVVTAMLIQRSVGGNLAEILDNIQYTIRERMRIQREVRTLTAQERMSGYIIGTLPIFLLIILSFVNRTYVDALLNTETGHLMLAGAAVLEIIGFFLITRIVAIRV